MIVIINDTQISGNAYTRGRDALCDGRDSLIITAEMTHSVAVDLLTGDFRLEIGNDQYSVTYVPDYVLPMAIVDYLNGKVEIHIAKKKQRQSYPQSVRA